MQLFLEIKGATRRQAAREIARLFTQAIVAIDGSRFKAVNSRDRSFSRGSLGRRMEQVEASIECYLSARSSGRRGG